MLVVHYLQLCEIVAVLHSLDIVLLHLHLKNIFFRVYLLFYTLFHLNNHFLFLLHYLDNLIPATAIWEMKIRDNQIVIATHGRGIWTIDLPQNEWVTNIETLSNAEQKLQIYPNPNQGKFTLKIPNSFQNQDLKIQIFDGAGKQIFTKTEAVKQQISLSLQQVSSGVYTIQILGKNQKQSTKLIIE